MYGILQSVVKKKIISYIKNRINIRQLHSELQTHRSLVKVEGNEARSYLQGIVTNDIEHFESGASSMYAMILNIKGRMLYDIIIYKQLDNKYLIDCASDVKDSLIKHLKMFRIRRKINVDSADDEYKSYAIFDPDIDFKTITHVDMESLYLNPKSQSESSINLKMNSEDIILSRDPRMMYLGHRLILPNKIDLEDVIPDATTISEGLYRNLRYRLGVAEGSVELPPTKCFPLEINCDYLHGVSFHKGCYIGQELVARTFHTGVIRKRYMPLIFEKEMQELPNDANVINSKGKSVGKVRAYNGQYGIGLMRISECLNADSLSVNDTLVTTFRPAWWPIEANKLKSS